MQPPCPPHAIGLGVQSRMFCSERTTSSPVAMACADSIASAALNDQQEPQPPWGGTAGQQRESQAQRTGTRERGATDSTERAGGLTWLLMGDTTPCSLQSQRFGSVSSIAEASASVSTASATSRTAMSRSLLDELSSLVEVEEELLLLELLVSALTLMAALTLSGVVVWKGGGEGRAGEREAEVGCDGTSEVG